MTIISTHIGLYSAHQQARPSQLKTTEREVNAQTINASAEVLRPPSTRSSFSIDPTRELKALHLDPKQSLATQTFLDIAHYQENFHLVDIFA